ncbi:MAG: Flp family type IVb pilin [Acidobacteriaceae bacterium]|jgi:pilus assembly protein Flp/PilA
MKQLLKTLATDESGQDLIEFALATALIGLLAGGAMKGLSNSVGTGFNSVGNSLTNAVA